MCNVASWKWALWLYVTVLDLRKHFLLRRVAQKQRCFTRSKYHCATQSYRKAHVESTTVAWHKQSTTERQTTALASCNSRPSWLHLWSNSLFPNYVFFKQIRTSSLVVRKNLKLMEGHLTCVILFAGLSHMLSFRCIGHLYNIWMSS